MKKILIYTIIEGIVALVWAVFCFLFLFDVLTMPDWTFIITFVIIFVPIFLPKLIFKKGDLAQFATQKAERNKKHRWFKMLAYVFVALIVILFIVFMVVKIRHSL